MIYSKRKAFDNGPAEIRQGSIAESVILSSPIIDAAPWQRINKSTRFRKLKPRSNWAISSEIWAINGLRIAASAAPFNVRAWLGKVGYVGKIARSLERVPFNFFWSFR